MSNLLAHIGKSNPLRTKWTEIVTTMQPHTQGVLPLELYKARQPNENADPYARAYRENNHRAITKSPIDTAIENYVNPAMRVEYSSYLPEATEEAVMMLRMVDGYKVVSLKEWTIQMCGRYRQTDPNAIVVVLPKHPFTKLQPTYTEELPDFDTVRNERIGVDVWLIPSTDIEYLDERNLLFKAGAYEVEDGRFYPYYFSIEMDDEGGQIYIVIPDKFKQYTAIPYYRIDHAELPIGVLGGKLQLTSDSMGDYVQYYLPDFWGAAQWGNQALCQMSDLQIVEKRFTYPEKVMAARDCQHAGAFVDPDTGKHSILDDEGKTTLCPSCQGHGYIIDTSPLGTTIVRQGSGMDSEGVIKDPVKYISPDTGILEHSAKRTEHYYTNMLNELFINRQNMTNQSGESKRWDSYQKKVFNSEIVRDIYRLYLQTLRNIAVYVNDDPNEVEINLPDELDVTTSEDALTELNEAKKAGVSHAIVVEKTKRYLLKMLGDTPENRFIVNTLARLDKLFGYSPAELRDIRAFLGDTVTQRDTNVHLFGLQIMQELTEDTEDGLDEAAILAAFNERIDALTPTVAAPNLVI